VGEPHLHRDRRDRLHLLDAESRLYTPLDPAGDQRLRAARARAPQRLSLRRRGRRRAYEVAESKQLGDELQRRARVVLRGLRGVGYMPDVVNPIRHPWLCAQIVSHRLLRWAVPIFLILAFVANVALLYVTPSVAWREFYVATLLAQVAFYGAAVVGLTADRMKVRPPRPPRSRSTSASSIPPRWSRSGCS
jgi:hypothetical protein